MNKTKTMKKFKNTFGVTGSTHAISHFAELAVKEGWKTFNSGYSKTLLWFQSSCELLKERQYTFWNPLELNDEDTINISTPEGWNKALDLMKEVEEEQLYGECYIDSVYVKKGHIYPIVKAFESSYEIKYSEASFTVMVSKKLVKIVPKSAYLAQEEAKKEKKYDFVCPHSGEGFIVGEEYCMISAISKDNNAPYQKNSIGLPYGHSNYAYFHKESDAKDWNKRMFGEKEEDVTKALSMINNNIKESENVIVSMKNAKISIDENGTYNILISKEIKDKVTIKFE